MSKAQQLSYSLLLKLQDHACFYCRKLLQDASFCPKTEKHGYTRDHFLPRSMGNNFNGNLVLSCDKCNRKKGSTLPSRDEICRFVSIWNQIKGGPMPELVEFVQTQRVIDKLEKWFGVPVDRKNII